MREIIQFLEGLEDPRQSWKIEHKLTDIVVITLFATLANADDWVEIAAWGEHHEKILKKYLELSNGAPSHDTIQRVMSLIKPEEFQNLLHVWRTFLNKKDGKKIKDIIAIDGKTMRGNKNKNQEALHVVSAWAKEGGICLGQKSADSKGKEIPMLKDLLDCIVVKGHIVTIDGIGTQKELARLIRNGKGDYVLVVKRNQPNLHDDEKEYFKIPGILEEIKKKGGYHETIERARGQCERREYYQTSDIKWLGGKKEWEGLKSIGMVRTVILKDDGTETVEERYYISSLGENAEVFARAVRGHWSVESMHWHLDVTFKEDANRTLDKALAENMNIVRKWALSLLKTADLGKKYSLKKKRFVFGFNLEKNLEIIMA